DSADAIAERTFTRHRVDKSQVGQRLREYLMKCWSAFVRGVETFRKYQGKKKAEGRDRKDEYAGMMAKDEGRRIADFGRWAPGADASDHVPDGSYGARDRMSPRGENSENVTNEAKFDESAIVIQNEKPVAVAANSGVDSGLDKPEERPGSAEGKDASDHVPDGSFVVGGGEREALDQSIDSDALPDPGAQPGCGSGTASAIQSASANMMADTTLSDGVTLSDGTSALASVTLSDGTTLLEGSQLDAGVGDPGGNSHDVSDADAVANRGDAMSPRGGNSENDTNEAKFDDSVIIIQNKVLVGVAANSSVDSGLDKREEQPGRAEGKDELLGDILASSPREAEILRPHLPRSP
ncbi:MAG: hypothetical protein ACHRXM_28250, partial [Isosphaerales bacterium]